jgi:hypothetical protein
MTVVLDIATKAAFVALVLLAYGALIAAAIEWLREHRHALPSGGRPVDGSPRPDPASPPVPAATTLSTALPRRGDLADPSGIYHDDGSASFVDAMKRFGSPHGSFTSPTHKVRWENPQRRSTDAYLAVVPLPGVCDCKHTVPGFHWPGCATHQPVDVHVEIDLSEAVPEDAIEVRRAA